MDSLSSLSRIEYQSGLVEGLSDIKHIPIHVVDLDKLDPDLLGVLANYDLFREDGIFGDPFIGEPIQIDWLRIFFGSEITHLLCYNRYVRLGGDVPEYFQSFHLTCELISRSTGISLERYGPPAVKRRGKNRKARHRGWYNRRLRELIGKKFRGFPIVFLDYFGPDDRRATKVDVSVCLDPDQQEGDTYVRESDADVRYDDGVNRMILDVVDYYRAKTVIRSEGIIGCPHEEGEDYPEGEDCPDCEFWRGRAKGRESQLDPVEVAP